MLWKIQNKWRSLDSWDSRFVDVSRLLLSSHTSAQCGRPGERATLIPIPDPYFRSFLYPPHIRRPNPPPTKYVKRNILSRVERVWNFKFSLSLTKCHFWHIWLELSTRLGRLAFALSDLGPIFAPRAPYSGALPPLTTWASLFTQNQMCQMIKRKVHIIKMHSQTYSQSQIQQDGGNVFCSSRFLFWSHFSDLHILKYKIGKFQYNSGWTCIQF